MLCCVCCRCKRWLINCRRADLDGIFKNDPEYLYRNARLCSAHFEDSQFVNFAIKTRLRPDAVPTLFSVRNTPPLVGSHRRGPIRRINFQQKRDATNNDSHGNSSTAGTSDQSTVMMNKTTDQAHLTDQHRPLLPSQSIIGKMLCTFVISSVHSRCHTTVHACCLWQPKVYVRWSFVYDSWGYSFTRFWTVSVYATVIHVLIAKFVKNDTYESLQVYQLCQHYEGNNLQ